MQFVLAIYAKLVIFYVIFTLKIHKSCKIKRFYLGFYIHSVNIACDNILKFHDQFRKLTIFNHLHALVPFLSYKNHIS